MPDLVDGLFLALPERAIRQKSVLFKKATNLVAGGEKVIVAPSALFARGEDRDYAALVEVVNEFTGADTQAIARPSFHKVRKD